MRLTFCEADLVNEPFSVKVEFSGVFFFLNREMIHSECLYSSVREDW